MIDPYATLGLDRDADAAAIKRAYRRLAKTAHPDGGGDISAFETVTAAYDLLRDPVRRKVYDDTGYDPQMADALDLKGLMVLETLVNDIILDEREPGSFDPVAALRRKLTDDILKNRFHILELERHRNRVRQHMDRLARRPGADVLGSMLRARSQSIAEAIRTAEKQIEAIEQAYAMIEGYAYELEPLVPRPTAEPEPEIAETGAETEAADDVAAAAPVEILETAGVAEPAEAPRAAE
ncbi:J domain-containing protein [Ciceribacter thiooxidans]|uniref:J domain-containing protein n=1 Tax=Ciceribacter thiooxidans TaxID=1969821 RepID=A0ABV7I5J2_9HYPH